jgi:hypothetical protein
MKEGAPKQNQQNQKVINIFSGDYKRNKSELGIKEGENLSYTVFGIYELISTISSSDSHHRGGQTVTLSEIEKLSDRIETPLVKEAISKLRADLIQKARCVGLVGAVIKFIDDFPKSKFSKGLMSSCANSHGEIDPSRFLHMVPDGLLFQMIMHHARVFGEELEDFSSHKQKLRKDFIKDLNRICTDGVLSLDFPSMLNKINESTVYLQDALAVDVMEVGDRIYVTAGKVAVSMDLVMLSSGLDPDVERKAYTHEMLHVLSGKTAVLSIGSNSVLVDPKSGLMIKEGDVFRKNFGFLRISYFKQTPETKLYWLNEATTEDLVAVFLGDKYTPNAYLKEKDLVRLLLNKGTKPIPRKLLYEAYFADSTSEHTEGEPPALRKFNDVVDESYGKKDFLTRLDDYVTKHGIEKSIEALKINPSQI